MRIQSLAAGAILAAFGIAVSGCGLNRVAADVFANALLLEITDPLGLDASETALIVRLGTIEDATSDNPKVEPVAGANVQVDSDSFNTIVIPAADSGEVNESSGAYVLTSSEDTNLVYVAGSNYTVTMNIPGGEFKGEYTMSLQLPSAATVTGYPDFVGAGETHVVGDSMTLSIEPAGEFDRGLVAVVVENAGSPELVYDSRPQSLGEWAKFLIGSFGGEVAIPDGGRTNPFDTADTLYGLGVTGVKSSDGPDESNNLHLLSEFMGGTMETALICTAPGPCIVP